MDGSDERRGCGRNNGAGDTPPQCKVCLRLGGCGCVGGCVQGSYKGSKACADRAGEGLGLDVPMVTLVKDAHYVDGRVPYELNEEVGTQIWLVRPAEFGFSGSF